MLDSDETATLLHIRYEIARNRVLLAGWRLLLLWKANPDWHLQPRVPAGNPDGGQWAAWLGAAAGSLLPALQRIARPALRRLREEARRLAPVLRRLPKRWDDHLQPSEESFGDETRRISGDSWQRFGYPTIRFRTENELRDYLGPAGPGREWHHIVEKRLAGRDSFPPELLHSTDNIISLPIEVHRRVSANMSSTAEEFENMVRRFGAEKLGFADQYDFGLNLIRRTLKDLGHDPADF